MTVWSYIGVVSGLICFLMPLGNAMDSENKKHARFAAMFFIMALILFLASVFWPNMSDSLFNPSSEKIFTLQSSNHQTEVTIYQEDTGKYYLLGVNETNLLKPLYRHYLDSTEAKTYIEKYNVITTSKDELVVNIDKIINS